MNGLNNILKSLKNSTAKYLILLLLIPVTSNAQYCTYTPTTAGYISNLQCYGISIAQALTQDWCPSHPSDPICAPYEQPTCQTSTQTQVLPCPSGQTGQTIQTSTSTCPNPRGNPVPGPWVTTSSSCQVIWQTQTQTLACPANYSGSITQTRQTTTNGQSTPWQTVSNTCVPNPPTCQASVQTQTLACPSGYTGSIQQTQTTTCPTPYSQPVLSPWVTTSNSCKQSVTNPTNPTSPVSPLNPTSTQTSSQSVTAASQSTSTTTSQQSVVIQTTVSDASPTPAQNSTPTATTSTGTSGNVATTPSNPPPKGKVSVGGLGLAMSLNTLQKPALKQYNPFPVESIGQAIPPEILIHDQTLMDMLSLPSLTQEPLKEELDFSQ